MAEHDGAEAPDDSGLRFWLLFRSMILFGDEAGLAWQGRPVHETVYDVLPTKM